ncbi:hypothetical protein KC726_03780 [Candidatus Woesebacteria bacterium]|nr:hypothetical protein [Candidatus Woesebacteria bacterium]
MNLLAQRINIGGVVIEGPLKWEFDPAHPGLDQPQTIGDVINRALLFAIPFAGVILFFVIIAGGYDILTSAGNPEALKKGQGKITTGFIGFGILALSYTAAQVVGYVFGLGGGIL